MKVTNTAAQLLITSAQKLFHYIPNNSLTIVAVTLETFVNTQEGEQPRGNFTFLHSMYQQWLLAKCSARSTVELITYKPPITDAPPVPQFHGVDRVVPRWGQCWGLHGARHQGYGVAGTSSQAFVVCCLVYLAMHDFSYKLDPKEVDACAWAPITYFTQEGAVQRFPFSPALPPVKSKIGEVCHCVAGITC